MLLSKPQKPELPSQPKQLEKEAAGTDSPLIGIRPASADPQTGNVGINQKLIAPELTSSEYIAIADVRAVLQSSPDRVIVIDARSERTYEDSDQDIPNAIRLSPDQAVRTATQLAIPKNVVLAVLCA